MLHDRITHPTSGVHKIAFSNIVWRCLERAHRQPAQLFRPSWEELAAPLAAARQTLSLASDEAIQAIMAAHPDAVRLVRTPQQGTADTRNLPGLIALLPLTQPGVEAMLEGRLDGSRPDPLLIAGLGEAPAAIYIWLIAMPGSLGRMLTAFAEALNSFLHEPVPIFSRAMHAHSDRLHRRSGFLPADRIYPSCVPGLQVILPERSAHDVPAKSAPPKMEVAVARTIEDIFKVFSVRSATYLAEQFCLYDEEFDGNDFCATHWLGTINGDAAGCIRACFFGDFAKIERLAVRTEYRQSRLAFQLVRTAIDHCARKGYRTLFGHSRLDLQRFWKVFGFRPVTDRPLVEFANIQYAEMRLDLPARPDRITIHEPALRLLRPEGSWDQPGPFETLSAADNVDRSELINARTRTVGKAKISV